MKIIVPESCRNLNRARAVKVVLPASMVSKVNAIVEEALRAERAHYDALRGAGWRTPTEISCNVLGMNREEMRSIRALVESVLGGTQHIRAPKNIGTKDHIGDAEDKFTPSQSSIGGTLIKPNSTAWSDVEMYALKIHALNMRKVVRALRAATR